MRIFNFWSRIEEKLKVQDETISVVIHGGSNVSTADAETDAKRRLAHVVARLAGQAVDDDGEYEADIREEITGQLDAQNIVTRNRYGAEVLNSADLMFMDLDRAPFRFRDIFLGSPSEEKKKVRIVAFIKERFAKLGMESLGIGIRLYETHSGVRAIVTGWKFGPKSSETEKLMKEFQNDELYSVLCKKQGCYRARLTPKPYRMRCKAHKVVHPFPDRAAETAFQTWLSEYELKRQNFATCRFIAELGKVQTSPVIQYHDERTGVQSSLKLA